MVRPLAVRGLTMVAIYYLCWFPVSLNAAFDLLGFERYSLWMDVAASWAIKLAPICHSAVVARVIRRVVQPHRPGQLRAYDLKLAPAGFSPHEGLSPRPAAAPRPRPGGRGLLPPRGPPAAPGPPPPPAPAVPHQRRRRRLHQRQPHTRAAARARRAHRRRLRAVVGRSSLGVARKFSWWMMILINCMANT